MGDAEMDSNEYEKFLDQKIADTKYILSHAAKEYLEAKAKYEAMVKEKENFLKSLSRE